MSSIARRVSRAAGAISLPPAGGGSGDTPPTGPSYVAFETLYQAGDTQPDGTMDLTAILARNRTATEGKIITFPEGIFMCSDFQDTTSIFQAGILIPSWVKGIWGSGRGTLGGSTGTIFTMKPMSSTRAYPAKDRNGNYYVPLQGTGIPVQLNVLKHYPTYPAIYKNFQVAGAAQGHIFSLFQSYGGPDGALAEDLLLCGWEGDNGAPPGETTALGINTGSNHVMRRVEVDGRRTPGGQTFGAMGITFQNAVNCRFEDCNLHHCRAACAVFYQTFNSTLQDCIIDSASAGTYALGNGGINLERTAGTKLIRPNIIGRQNKVHITHSNDTWTLTRGGKTYTTAGGSLEIIDPTYNSVFGNGYLYVQTWIPYSLGDFGNGNSMTYPGAMGSDGISADGPSCAPYVHSSDGSAITYLWAFDKHYLGPITRVPVYQ